MPKGATSFIIVNNIIMTIQRGQTYLNIVRDYLKQVPYLD